MTADPKAAEREAAAQALVVSILDNEEAKPRRPIVELFAETVALLTTRERDAAVGALLAVEEVARRMRYAGTVFIEAEIKRRRLALEQGTCASCGKPMEGERFTVKASVRADLVGKTVGCCCWPPDHGTEGTPATCWHCPLLCPGCECDCHAAPGTPATREETPCPKCGGKGYRSQKRPTDGATERVYCKPCIGTGKRLGEPTTGGTER